MLWSKLHHLLDMINTLIQVYTADVEKRGCISKHFGVCFLSYQHVVFMLSSSYHHVACRMCYYSELLCGKIELLKYMIG